MARLLLVAAIAVVSGHGLANDNAGGEWKVIVSADQTCAYRGFSLADVPTRSQIQPLFPSGPPNKYHKLVKSRASCVLEARSYSEWTQTNYRLWVQVPCTTTSPATIKQPRAFLEGCGCFGGCGEVKIKEISLSVLRFDSEVVQARLTAKHDHWELDQELEFKWTKPKATDIGGRHDRIWSVWEERFAED